ncbi:MAG: hypothetical protein Q9168_006009 [Polycauliona sp. 1 TL-2023]
MGPGYDLGYLVVEPPVPDPDTLFDTVAQDPLLAGLPSDLRSKVDPALVIPSPTTGCQRQKCFQFIASADVFYFGPEPTNTACLSAITNAPPSPTTPPISMDLSSVYVVYQPIEQFDNCRKWIGENFAFTASFRSDTLSTIEYKTDSLPVTKVMNYEDLPCPPPDMAPQLDPEVPYFPILKQLFRTWASINGSDESCEQIGVRDPPVRAVLVDRISGPKDGGDSIA